MLREAVLELSAAATLMATEYSVSLNQTPFLPLEVAVPQDYLFFGIAAPTPLRSYGIGCRRLHGPNYSITS